LFVLAPTPNEPCSFWPRPKRTLPVHPWPVWPPGGVAPRVYGGSRDVAPLRRRRPGDVGVLHALAPDPADRPRHGRGRWHRGRRVVDAGEAALAAPTRRSHARARHHP